MRKDEAKFITEFLSEAGTKAENNDYFGYVLLDKLCDLGCGGWI